MGNLSDGEFWRYITASICYYYCGRKSAYKDKILTIFGCKTFVIDPKNILSLLNFIAEFQDGGKIQNGVKKRKNLNFAANWPIFNIFQKSFLCFVCPTNAYKKPVKEKKIYSRWRRKSMKTTFIEKIGFYKTAYNLGDTPNFYKRQTLKCCPNTQYIPSVFVKRNIPRWQRFSRWRSGVFCMNI